METKEIRWKQRFQTFEKAYLTLKSTVELAEQRNLSELEEAGVVQHFEILNELSWKVMREYLLSQGVSVKHNPVDTIRHSFQNELIEDAEAWMKAVEKRNEAAHTYDGEILEEIVYFVNEKFYLLAHDLYCRLKEKL